MATAALIPLSPSMASAAQRFAPEERIRSWALVHNLLAAHPEYGGNLGGQLTSAAGPADGERKTAEEWIEALDNLFDPSRVTQLHGRIAIMGLARLDPELERFLDTTGLIAAIVAESREPFGSLLREVAPEQQQSRSADPASQASKGASPRVVSARKATAAGYSSDHVTEAAQDRLDIEHEVQTIAHVLAAKRVVPPLSLGLFGDWGTGKSFFMTKLRSYITAIASHYRAEEKETGRSSEWCTRVLHIEFNAWHYSDANLWASLVTRIYEALQSELKPGTSDDELKKKLEDEVQKAQGVTREAAAQFKQAERRVEHANTALLRSRANLEEREQRLDTLIGDVGVLLANDKELKGKLDKAARALGAPRAAEAYRALQDLHLSMSSLAGRLSAIGMAVLRSPGSLLLLAALAIAVPTGMSWILAQPWLDLSAAGRRIIEISTALLGVVAWLQRQVGRGVSFVLTVENALHGADTARKQRIETSEDVRNAIRQMALAESEQTAARQNLEQSQAELQRLQTELQELSPERKLFRLLEERGRSATYTRHLGIISLIREDFEKISALLARLEQEPRDLTQDPPPIQRIILYIDDLDRCRPERVVQVLEAVHMLLAFPLFTVVVGVDPRWLRHSLAQMNPTTITHEAGGTNQSSAGYSTPQDYLEKIFQIPFALRRVEKQGYENLVADLLRAPPTTVAMQAGLLNVRNAPIDLNSNVVVLPNAATAQRQDGPLPAEVQAEPNAHQPQTDATFTPIAPQQLEFTALEKQDINRLWPLFTTPRSVKRFINTYRLLRASVHMHNTAAFEGSEAEPGEYQIALLLLAIVSSSPNELEAFQSSLLDFTRKDNPKGHDGLWQWGGVLAELRQPILVLDPDWADIDAALTVATFESFERVFTKEDLARWMFRVSRYTFVVLPPRAVKNA